MAGDWIKVRTSLDTDPNIMRLARLCRASVALCRASVAQTIGACVIFWGWASIHTDDGVAHGVALDWLDEFVGLPGFSDAMQEVGWLEVDGQTITIPRFERYNESPAKARAREANTERQRRLRADRVAPLSRDVSRDCRANVAPREEKRREEKNQDTPLTPQGGESASPTGGPDADRPVPADDHTGQPRIAQDASDPPGRPDSPPATTDAPEAILAHIRTIPSKTQKPTPPPIPASLDTPAFRAAWDDWLAYRRERRLATLKPRSIAAKFSELAEWGPDRAVSAIRASIANNWQGIFEPRESNVPDRTHDQAAMLADIQAKAEEGQRRREARELEIQREKEKQAQAPPPKQETWAEREARQRAYIESQRPKPKPTDVRPAPLKFPEPERKSDPNDPLAEIRRRKQESPCTVQPATSA